MVDDSKEVNGWRRAAIMPYLSCDDCGRPAPYFNARTGERRCAQHVPIDVSDQLSGASQR
jgi:hypothetical protein